MSQVNGHPPSDAPPPANAPGQVLPLRDATSVLAALNHALNADLPPKGKVETLLADLQSLLDFEADTEVLLYTDPHRKPAPRLIDRAFFGPTFDRIEPRSHEAMQHMIDEVTGPVWDAYLEKAIAHRPMPMVATTSQGVSAEWFETVFKPRHLDPIGWADVLSSCWAAGDERIVSLNVFRRPEHRAFTAADEALMQMMVLAAGPLMDKELLEPVVTGKTPEVIAKVQALTARQQEVLGLLLEGMSEKEAARALHRSTETVHSHVKQIYKTFDVASRGELMACFVDERLRWKVGDGDAA